MYQKKRKQLKICSQKYTTKPLQGNTLFTLVPGGLHLFIGQEYQRREGLL
jgi:hypothetical protein